MVKYIVHNNDPICSNVDEITLGNPKINPNDIEFDTFKYKKYITEADVRAVYFSMKDVDENQTPSLKIIHISTLFHVSDDVFGLPKFRKRYKYCLHDSLSCNDLMNHIKSDHRFMLSLDTYKKYVDRYPVFCSESLKEYELEYFNKGLMYQYQSDYDLSFIYN